jgi:uncharacterized lipoprotein (TIGR02269 family)
MNTPPHPPCFLLLLSVGLSLLACGTATPGVRTWMETAQEEQSIYRHGFLPAFPRLEGTLRKHHLFPQANEFRDWFRAHGINVHDWTMVIPLRAHQRIHGGDGRGGLWNKAWREFMRNNFKPRSLVLCGRTR